MDPTREGRVGVDGAAPPPECIGLRAPVEPPSASYIPQALHTRTRTHGTAHRQSQRQTRTHTRRRAYERVCARELTGTERKAAGHPPARRWEEPGSSCRACDRFGQVKSRAARRSKQLARNGSLPLPTSPVRRAQLLLECLFCHRAHAKTRGGREKDACVHRSGTMQARKQQRRQQHARTAKHV